MGFEAPDSGVHRSCIWCHDTAIAISLEKDQDVILGEQSAPEDGRNRKGMKHRGILSLNSGEAAHWKCGGEPRQS